MNPSDTRASGRLKIGLNGMLLGGHVSGVETAILGLARGLAEFGQEEYVFFLPRESWAADLAGPRFATRRVAWPVRFRLLRVLWEQGRLPGALEREGLDLLHAPGYVAPLGARRPVVVTVYDLIALLHPEWCKPSNVLHYRVMLPLSARRAAGIIVPSECTRRDLAARLPGAKAPTRVIPLGVGGEFRAIADKTGLAALRERYGLKGPFVLFVGNIEPKKNLGRLVEAFTELKRGGNIPHRLAIAGRREWAYPAVKRRVQKLGLGGEVTFLGHVSAADLVGLYNLADVFVFPSLYEGFGIPPLEAMACGVPVVASKRGALPETLGEAALFVDPLDPADIARGLREAIANKALRGGLVERGLRRAALFTWHRTVKETEAFYREACGNVECGM